VLQTAGGILEQMLETPVRVKGRPAGRRHELDGELVFEGVSFLVEVKSDARSASVARAIEQLKSYQAHDAQADLLLIVPQMTETGAELCKRARINWMDLNGNAEIRNDRFVAKIRGMRNELALDLLARRGLNPFSPKASAIVQILLSDPKRAWTRADLGAASHLDKGFVSKILTELIAQEYVIQESVGRRVQTIRVRNPMVLLDAWAERYRQKQPSRWSLLAVHDGFDAAATVCRILERERIAYALTGLPAAAEYTNFGTFRRVDVYVAEPLGESAERDLPMDADSRGRNVFIMVDRVAANFGVQNHQCRRYASPALVYLDLAKLPERSAEARDEMRNYLQAIWA